MTAMLSSINLILMEEYIAITGKLAADYHIALVSDIWGNRFYDPTLKADDFHPNKKEHMVLMGNIYKKLNEAGFF